MRVESRKPVKNGGWVHQLSDPLPAVPPPKPKALVDDVAQDARWRPIIERMANCDAAHIERLAVRLGVSRASLESLR
ncbi:MAG: hypothetical protein V2B18_16800, partial [Pseudomonadota bacterium]